MKTLFTRYFRFASILWGIGLLVIIFMFLLSLKNISDYNTNLKTCFENSDYESIGLSIYSADGYDFLDTDNILDIDGSKFSIDLYYLDDRMESFSCLIFLLSAVMCIIFGIYAFNDERKDFLKVLPVRREYIYTLRALISLLLSAALFLAVGFFLYLLYRLGYCEAKSIISEYINSDISFNSARSSVPLSLIFCLCLCGSAFLSLLHTIFSKPNFCFITGMIGIIIFSAGFAGIFNFFITYDLISADMLYYAINKLTNYLYINLYDGKDTYIALTNCILLGFTVIFTLLGLLLYKTGKAENRKGFFMFAPAKYITYIGGSFFGGFAFFAFLSDIDFFEKTYIFESLFAGVLTVIFGMSAVYYVIRKIVYLCE